MYTHWFEIVPACAVKCYILDTRSNWLRFFGDTLIGTEDGYIGWVHEERLIEMSTN